MSGTIIYDGDCDFCAGTVRWAERRILDPSVTIVPWQFTDLNRYGLTPHDTQDAVWWIAPDGTAYPGAEAVTQVLSGSDRPWSWLGRASALPGIAGATRVSYRWVADNRYRLGFVTNWLRSHE